MKTQILAQKISYSSIGINIEFRTENGTLYLYSRNNLMNVISRSYLRQESIKCSFSE